MTAEVQAIRHKDVRGKEMLYLKIIKDSREVIINVGQQTFNSIEGLEKPIPTETQKAKK